MRLRRWILRGHGGLLAVLGVGNAIMSTYGMQTGEGLMGFLRDHRLGHVGLLQAYLLAALVGAVLWYGSHREERRMFHILGALAHLAILPAYAFHWDYLAEVAPQGRMLRNAVGLHLLLVALEGWAAITYEPKA